HRANREKRQSPPEGECALALIHRNNVANLTVIERRSCFDLVGPFSTALPVVQDYHHWIQAALQEIRFGYIPEPLSFYRWRASSISSSPLRLHQDLVRIFNDLLTQQSSKLTNLPHAVDILRGRLYNTQRQLAYFERVQGQQVRSLRRILSL